MLIRDGPFDTKNLKKCETIFINFHKKVSHFYFLWYDIYVKQNIFHYMKMFHTRRYTIDGRKIRNYGTSSKKRKY